MRTRREFLGTVGTVAAGSLIPFVDSTTASEQSVTPALSANITPTGRLDALEEAVVLSGDRLAVHLEYSEDDKQTAVDWIESNYGEGVRTEHDAIDTVTVGLHPDDITGTPLGNGALPGKEWVEQLDVALELSYPEPVDQTPEDPLTTGTNALGGALLSAFSSSLPTDGVATDPEEGTVQDATAALDADATGQDGSGLTVGVIDTGCNTAGGDVFGDESRILDASWNPITDETVQLEGLDAVADGDGHGTHVTATIAADPADADDADDYQGVAPGCDILVLKALADDGGGSTENIVDAITYAADEGVDVLNLSLGSPLYSVTLDRALAYAAGSDVVSLAATGNDRQGTRWAATPSDAADAIPVAAGTVDAPDEAETAYFSNIGPDPGTTNSSNGETAGAGPAVAAPGMALDALVADDSGSVSTEALSGTSMATPCVAGVALQLLDAGVDAEDVRERLEETANPVPAAGTTEVGAGYPSAQQAIDDEEPDEDQAEARTDAAQSRDRTYGTLSTLQGGPLARLI